MATILAADLYGDVPPEHRPRLRELVPGLTVVLLGTLAAGFVSSQYGAPLTLMALLIGMALNFLATDRRLTPGLGFAGRQLLRWGIVLIGARVTVAQIVGLGPLALLGIVGILAATMTAGLLVARRLGFPTGFGVLAGGAVAICGASAAMALATTLGERRAGEAQLTLVLVGISAASAGAMVLYPVAAHLLSLTDAQAGFLLGASIHDVAQALGAGYAYSEAAGQVAAIVKLTRVALLAPVLAVVAVLLPRGDGEAQGPGFPWFVAGFFALAGANSLGLVPTAASTFAGRAAAGLLAAAVTATGIRSSGAMLLRTGLRPMLVILAASAVAFALALIAALLLVR